MFLKLRAPAPFTSPCHFEQATRMYRHFYCKHFGSYRVNFEKFARPCLATVALFPQRAQITFTNVPCPFTSKWSQSQKSTAVPEITNRHVKIVNS